MAFVNLEKMSRLKGRDDVGGVLMGDVLGVQSPHLTLTLENQDAEWQRAPREARGPERQQPERSLRV